MLTRLNSAMHRGRNRISIRDESGQGLVEYALIIAIVSLGAIASLTFLKGSITGLFSKAGSSINLVEVGSGGTGTGTGTGGGPVITVTQQPTDPTTATTATFQFTSSPAATSYSCTVSGTGGSTQACTPSTNVTFNGLAVGSHTFTVTPTPAGTDGTYTWTINAPANVAPSYVSGGNLGGCTPNCDDGETINVSASVWNGTPAPTITYQWKTNGDSGDAGACDFGAGGTSNGWGNGPGSATGTSYQLPNPFGFGTDSVGVRITATNTAGTVTRDVCTTFDH